MWRGVLRGKKLPVRLKRAPGKRRHRVPAPRPSQGAVSDRLCGQRERWPRVRVVVKQREGESASVVSPVYALGRGVALVVEE